MPDPTLGDWAAVAGAVFTAAAAGAALLTTRQGRKLIEAAEKPPPLLEVQVLTDIGSLRLRLAIVNTGRGIARGASFMVHAVDQAAQDVIGDGFIAAGVKVHVVTEIGPMPGPSEDDPVPATAMVGFRDAEGFMHYRSSSEDEYVPKTLIRRRPKYPDRVGVFKRFYPDVDIEAAQPVGSRVEKHA